jgi:hypothetical protein
MEDIDEWYTVGYRFESPFQWYTVCQLFIKIKPCFMQISFISVMPIMPK